MIYFDNAATTFPKPNVVYNEMKKFYSKYGVNAGRGSYKIGEKSVKLINDTRKLLNDFFNIKSNKKIVFTTSATMSINTIIKGLNWSEGDVIYYSPYEHNAVLRSLYFIEKKLNIKLVQIPIHPKTLEINMDKLINDFRKNKPNMVILSQVSNVFGYILPINKIVKEAKKYNSLILVDGAQGAGLVEIDLKNIDYYVWTAHKTLYGPFGIAGFIIDGNAPEPTPLLHGGTGTQSEKKDMPNKIPLKYEAGSMNISAVAGLNASLNWIKGIKRENLYKKEKKLLNFLHSELTEFIDINLFIPKNKHTSIVSVKFSGYSSNEIGQILNEQYDIAVRTGLHCAPVAHELLGTMPDGLVRFSLSYFNTLDEINYLIKSLQEFVI